MEAPAPTAPCSRRSRTSARNRYDESSGVLELTEAQAEAHRALVRHYSRLLLRADDEERPAGGSDHGPGRPRSAHGLLRLDRLGGCGGAARAQLLYTNNWPPEPRVENEPTANVIVWSVLSLIALLGGIGLLFAVFGRWNILGWHGREQATLSFRTPGDIALTRPSAPAPGSSS